MSTKERIQLLLSLLKKANVLSFSKTLRKSEGKKGAVVTLLASLELAKDGLVELIQNEENEIYIKSMSNLIINIQDFYFNGDLFPPKTECTNQFKKCPCLSYE